ncbi:MAG: hypothetical protein QOG45_3027 [Chloroflexota bacterium]|jgi:hypothetical protein|nr:hypothetical protein [Chloroflexota bacterium]
MLSTDLIADMIRLEQARRLRDAALVRRVRRRRTVVGVAPTATPSPCDCGADVV